MIQLGLVQAPSAMIVAENLDTIKRFAEEAKAASCQAVCFPEAFLTGYAPEQAAHSALSVNSSAIQQVTELAESHGIDLLVGFMEEAHGVYYLTHGLFRADGTAAFYRKTHLGEKEQRYFSAGDVLPVFSLSCGLRIGFQVCVETHFPEITQTLSLQGAEVIFAPHAAPSTAQTRRRIWGKIIPARSYDNRVYLACCNPWDGARYGGGTLVTDPNGEIAASCFEDHPALTVFSVDREQLQAYHNENASIKCRYYPARRKPELYQ